MDVPDWGTSLVHCVALGPKAKVVRRHRPPRARARTSSSSSRRCSGWTSSAAFDFNSRFYADDDLMVGSADPFQLFRIIHECVKAGALERRLGVAFMLDQCHNIEPKIPGQIRSVMNVQEATAKALLVDRRRAARRPRPPATCSARTRCSWTPTTPTSGRSSPTCATDLGLDPDPMAAYARSGYADRIAAERVGGAQAGWGA